MTDAAISLVESFRFLDGERIVERGALAFEMALQDDYVKFFGLGHEYLKKTSHQVLGMITNARYLDGLYLRGMRDQKVEKAKEILSLDLGGQVSERAEVDGPDENVFDIEQGVAISLAFQHSGSGYCATKYERIAGSREAKYEALLEGLNAFQPRKISPRAPLYLLKPLQNALAEEYAASPELREIMPANSGAIITSRDGLVIDLDRNILSENIGKFGDLNRSDENIKAEIGFSAKKSWNLTKARKAVEQDIKSGSSKGKYRKVLYRPWDTRHIYYDPRIIDTPSKPISEELYAGENLCLCTPRIKNTDRFNHVLASELPAEKKAASHDRATQMFPLFFEESESSDGAFRRPNIAANVGDNFQHATRMSYNDGIPRGEQQSMGADYRNQNAEQIGLLDQPWDGRGDLKKDFGPRDLFDWIYAILHAPSYRSRYAEFLKSDFPRIPIPKDRATFAALVPLGRRLVALHLLKPEEEPVLKNPDIRFAGTGEARVEKGYPKYKNGKVEINASRWFEDVPKETWEFHVGGYQVCDKWLKDRAGKGGQNPRPGRVLTEEDILHYRRVVTALTETRTIMAEIDQAIDKHGGWPGAFAVGTDAEEGE